MRSLYWKIFISFWLATILIILTTAWIIGHIARESSLPAHEQLFMDSYANAAIATYEAGKKEALKDWLERIGMSRHMAIFLVTSKGEVIGSSKIPKTVEDIRTNFNDNSINEGIFKTGNFIVSHKIFSERGISYRLIALSDKPLTQFIKIPWAGMALRLLIAIFVSGLICYLLSLYLTKPLRSLRMAAKMIAQGKLHTRVEQLSGHQKDEIGELSKDFNYMAERLEAIVLSKERLLQDISHELRSPLARLSIALELARNKCHPKATAEHDRIELEIARLNTLIGEILEYARMNKSITKLHLKKSALVTLIQTIVDDANYEFSQNSTVQRVQFESHLACHPRIEQRLIHRAVENILRNALRYSGDAVVEVVLNLAPDKKQVSIIIKDRGPGVPEEELDNIFKPFYRVDTSREKKTGGYGLGLAIALQAVELHKGRISAENRAGGGLEVCITLPI